MPGPARCLVRGSICKPEQSPPLLLSSLTPQKASTNRIRVGLSHQTIDQLFRRLKLASDGIVKDIVRPGETISSTTFERRPGGKGANQAVAIAKALGTSGKVDLECCVGEDGRWLLRELEKMGVYAGGVAVVKVSFRSHFARPRVLIRAVGCPLDRRDRTFLTILI
jgi:hypothetical protein